MTNDIERQERFLKYFLSLAHFSCEKLHHFRFAAFCISIAAHFFLFGSLLHTGKTIPSISSPFNTTAFSIHVSVISDYGPHKIPSVSEENKHKNYSGVHPQHQERFLKREKESLPRVSTGNLAAPYYFLPRELTEKPLVIKDIPPDLGVLLPEISPQRVKVNLFINEAGDIDNVSLDESRLPDYAELLLRENFSKVKFYPGKIDGIAVKSQLQIEIAIEPESNLPAEPSRSLLH